MKNKKINLASLKKSLQLFLLFFIVFSSPLFAQTGHWEKLNPPVSPPARQISGNGMTQIGYRKALLFGGRIVNKSACNDIWLFDLDTKTWSELKPKNPPPIRFNHNFCRLNENTAVLFGGETSGMPFYEDTWLFDLSDTSWTKLELDTHPDGRVRFGMSQITENEVLLFGGQNMESETKQDTWLFNLENKTWKLVDSVQDWWDYGKRPSERWVPIIAQIGSRKVVLYSGIYFGHYFSDTWLFDLDSMNWRKLDTKGWIDSVYQGSGTNLFGTKMLSFGGENTISLLNNTIIFDLFDTTWTKLEVNQSPPERTACALSKLDDAKALLFGGNNLNGDLDDTWLFTADINGVDEKINVSDDFQISPNPAVEYIEISVGAQGNVPDNRIFNVFGETIENFSELLNNSQFSIPNSQLRIDVSGLPSGVYFVRMGDRVRKFVKL